MTYERRKIRVGKVVSDKMDKTVVVVVGWRRPHRVYQKPVRRETRFMAHDPQNLCKIGDTVRIRECRPISKTKRWRIEEILQREDIAEIQPDDITAVVTEDNAPAPEQPAAAPATAAAIDAKVAIEPDNPPTADAPSVDEQGDATIAATTQDNAAEAAPQPENTAEIQAETPAETQPEPQQEEPRQ